MSTVIEIIRSGTAAEPRAKRSVADLLAQLNRLAQTSPNLIAKPAGRFQINDWSAAVSKTSRSTLATRCG